MTAADATRPLDAEELEALGFPLKPGTTAYPFYPSGILIPNGDAGYMIVDECGDDDNFVDLGVYDPEGTDGAIWPIHHERLASVVALLRSSGAPTDPYRWVTFAKEALEILAPIVGPL